MLHELVDLAEQLEEQGELNPLGFKEFSSAPVDWILDVTRSPPAVREAHISGPRPSRQRSSGISPLLLADKASYVLGVAEEGKEARAKKEHEAFLELLENAWMETGVSALREALDHLRSGNLRGHTQLERDHIVAIAEGPGKPLYNHPDVRAYWQSVVSEKFLSNRKGSCLVCGETKQLLRILPQPITGLGDSPVQISSFNKSAFKSYGFEQTRNASLCYMCGAQALQALNHLIHSDSQSFWVTENQLAVFWTTAEGIQTEKGQKIDIEEHLRASLKGDIGGNENESHASLAEIRELLRVPWTARQSSLRVEEGIYLAVLSANRARLVVREWMTSSPNELKLHLRTFLDVQCVQGPWGDSPESFSLGQLISPLEAQVINTETRNISTYAPVEPNLVRALLLTTYAGIPPPVEIEARIVNKLQNPSLWKLPWLTHRAMALLNLARTSRQGSHYGESMSEDTTERLDTENTSTAYRCGRLLAVLADIQGQAQDWDLNTTIVDRNFSAAATAPASTFPRLIHLAETAHLPKIRREGSDRFAREDLEEVVSAIESFPTALGMKEQGDFALGFYHQRAEFRRKRAEYNQAQEAAMEVDQ